MLKQKICKVCGNTFEEHSPAGKLYCSQQCHSKYWQEEHRKNKSIKEKKGRTCLNCKGIFDAHNFKQRFCSPICQSEYWRNNHQKYCKHLLRSWRKKNTEKIKLYKNKQRQKFPTISIAQQRAWKNIELGKTCELCGTSKNLERHHPDYDYPLLTVTVCKKCHGVIHRGK